MMERPLPQKQSKQYHGKKVSQDTYERMDPGEIIILAMAISLAVALFCGLVGNALHYYFPIISMEPFSWVGGISTLVFVGTACLIVACSD